MPQPFLGFLLQSFPLVEKCVPLSGPLAPLWSLTNVRQHHLTRPFAAGFTRLPRPKPQLPRSPVNYGSPFHRPESPLPGRPRSRAAYALPTANSIHFEALSSPRVRSARHELPRDIRPLLSWPFASPELSYMRLGASNPPELSLACLPRPLVPRTPTDEPKDRIDPRTQVQNSHATTKSRL
jgi:hypothetical protein